MLPCRLIVDPPQEGAWNMAVDEALLEEAAERGAASLRFYQWREPTLSLGYFQAYRERQSHLASRDATVVRRLSGGGALLHHRELTYSLCLPAAHPLARRSSALYDAVHGSIIQALHAWELHPLLSGSQGAPAGTRAQTEPFLCFARRTEHDVVLRAPDDPATFKIVGSAQRRRRGAVLQHGAIMLSASPMAPELLGVEDAAERELSPVDLIAAIQERLAESLGLELRPHTVDGKLRETAQRLQSEKYAQRSWTERR
jgi:lipoyl(octanoyl) transferase